MNQLIEFSNKFLDDGRTENDLVDTINGLSDEQLRFLFERLFRTNTDASTPEEIRKDVLGLLSHFSEFQTAELVKILDTMSTGNLEDIDEGLFDAFKKSPEEKAEKIRQKNIKKNMKMATKEYAMKKKAEDKKAREEELARQERNSKLAYGFGLEESKSSFLDTLLGTDGYETRHASHSQAMKEIKRFVESKGYSLEETEMSEVAGWDGVLKLYEGNVNRFTASLYKDEILQKKALHAQIFGEGKEGYRLNIYIK